MLVATKISINAINDDQKEFVFNLMKEHSVAIFFQKKKIKDFSGKNVYQKARLKVLEIILECERSMECSRNKKSFFQKHLIKTYLKIKKVFD